MSDSLWPHESQHARPPCPSPTPGVHSDSSPSTQWCHPAISSSVVPFSSCPPSLPASESFPTSQLFTWGGQNIGVTALASFLPKKASTNLHYKGLVGPPCSPRDSQESSPTPQSKSINSLALSFLHSHLKCSRKNTTCQSGVVCLFLWSLLAFSVWGQFANQHKNSLDKIQKSWIIKEKNDEFDIIKNLNVSYSKDTVYENISHRLGNYLQNMD